MSRQLAASIIRGTKATRGVWRSKEASRIGRQSAAAGFGVDVWDAEEETRGTADPQEGIPAIQIRVLSQPHPP